jgi:CBS domain containing-hemolysin-like protein
VILRDVLHHFKIADLTIPQWFETEIDEESMLSYIFLHDLKHFATKGDSLHFGPLTLTVTKIDEQRIQRVKVEYVNHAIN